MKSWPRWIVWAGATAVIWAAWIAFVQIPLQRREHQEAALESEWAVKEREMLARIQSTPRMLEQLDALGGRIDSTFLTFPHAIAVTEYMDELSGLGRLSGIRSVEVTPELVSMMALTKSNSGREPIIDTLIVELNATGGFQEIGKWLDQVEAQRAFRKWNLGQWDRGPEPGTVRFTGSAAFLIAVPRSESS